MSEKESMLIRQEKYLEAGIHIGTKLKVVDMNRFIYRARNDGLFVLDLRKVDERIRMAGKMLASFDPKDIIVVASRTYSSNAASKFAQISGARLLPGRIVPGTFTNVHRDDFTEPKLLFTCDPKGERQAVLEAGKMGICTIGLCDTDNYTSYLDWVIPCNNKGRRSLALIFYLLAREMSMACGKISSYDEFKATIEEFETPEKTEAEIAAAKAAAQAAAGAAAPGGNAQAAETTQPAAGASAEEASSTPETAKEAAAQEQKEEAAQEPQKEEAAEKDEGIEIKNEKKPQGE